MATVKLLWASAWVMPLRPHDPSGGGRPGPQKACALPLIFHAVKGLPSNQSRRVADSLFAVSSMHVRGIPFECEPAAPQCVDNAVQANDIKSLPNLREPRSV
jgi:hypothetical protein